MNKEMITGTSAVIMLTDNDLTVDNAAEFFTSAKNSDIVNWGFKSVGQPHDVMYKLAETIKAAGKNLFIESITYTQEEYKFLAEFAKEAHVDCILGTVFDQGLLDDLNAIDVLYTPFVGKTPGLPGVIVKSLDEIKADYEQAIKAGCAACSLPAYLHKEYTGVEILKAVRDIDANFPILVAGRVKTQERIDEMFQMNTSFTIGGALFRGEIVPGTFAENVEALAQIMKKGN